MFYVDSQTRQGLLELLPPASADQSMEVDSSPLKPATVKPIPEIEIYIRLLLIHYLLASSATYGKAMEISKQTVEKIQVLNRRTMDPITAKVWYALEQAYELGGKLADARP